MTLSDRAKEFCLAEKHVMSLLKFFEWPIDNTALANNIFIQVLNPDFISFQNLSHITSEQANRNKNGGRFDLQRLSVSMK